MLGFEEFALAEADAVLAGAGAAEVERPLHDALVQRPGAFEAANGRELQALREIALKNSGTAASPAQVKRWLELNGELTGVLMKIFATSADLISGEADRMLSAAWRSRSPRSAPYSAGMAKGRP